MRHEWVQGFSVASWTSNTKMRAATPSTQLMFRLVQSPTCATNVTLMTSHTRAQAEKHQPPPRESAAMLTQTLLQHKMATDSASTDRTNRRIVQVPNSSPRCDG